MSKHLGKSLSLAAACALIAACQVGNSAQAPQGTTTTGLTREGADQVARAKADALGLSRPDSFVKNNEFQIKDANGQPLAGVTVVVDGQRFVTNEKGLITLPEAIAQSNEVPLAQIEKDGFVGQTISLMPGQAYVATQVDAKRTAIGESGGIARNAAGTLEVVFPPGTLKGTGNIAATLSYSPTIQPGTPLPGKMAFQDMMAPDLTLDVDIADFPVLGQYRYNLDLGGATLAPGSSYSVRFKVQGDMLEVLKGRLASGRTFETLSDQVSKDVNGDLWLTMAIKGPAEATASSASKYSLLAAQCQSLYGETVADVEANWRQSAVCANMGDPGWWNANRPNSNVGLIMTHDSRYNGGGCVYFQYDPNLYVCRSGGYQGAGWTDRRDVIMRRWYSSSINASVRYSSDDPRVNGGVPQGAWVYFNHALTPVHPAPLAVPLPGDGTASTIGQQGASGRVSAAVPAEPYTYSSAASYNVDCRTVGLSIVKNMPAVTLSLNVQGDATTQSLTVPSNLGDYGISTLRNPVVKPTIAINQASQSFSIAGSRQPDQSTWVDYASRAVDAGWNTYPWMPVDVYFSKPIGATLVYQSNDASVPADQRPASRWNAQPVSGASVLFSHAVSGAAGKPANRDQLSFSNVTNASTWGLNGAAGRVNGARTYDNISFSGATSYNVNGQTVTVKLAADLPAISLKITGPYSDGWVVTYKLDGASTPKTMALPEPDAAGFYRLNLPVEDTLNNPGRHTFQLIGIDKGNEWSAVMPDGGRGFPVVNDLYRGKVVEYTTLKFESFGAK